MFFNLKNATILANTLLVIWLLWHIAFMKGYQDAVNDLSKKGYQFDSAMRAFR